MLITKENYYKLKTILKKGTYVNNPVQQFEIYKVDQANTAGHRTLNYEDYGRTTFGGQQLQLVYEGRSVKLDDKYSRDHFHYEYGFIWFSTDKLRFKEYLDETYRG